MIAPSITMLILFSDAAVVPAPPTVLENWVDNLGNSIVDNNGNYIVFNVPA